MAIVFFGPPWPGLAWNHALGLERAKKTVAGQKNVWPPAGLELIHPAGKLNQTGWLMFFGPGQKQIHALKYEFHQHH